MSEIPLKRGDEERLDSLLKAARSFHYAALTFTGFIGALVLLPQATSEINIPFLNVKLPLLQGTVSIYIMVNLFCLAADKMFRLAYPYMKADTRRVSFAWIAIGPTANYIVVSLWLILPPILCGICIMSIVEDGLGSVCVFLSFFFVLGSRVVRYYWDLIVKRQDERGGDATFSIYLLYWYRIIRSWIAIAFFSAPIWAIVPSWRKSLIGIGSPGLLIIMGTFLLARLVGGFPFIYRWIDHIGKKYGFPAKSNHYK